MMAPTNTNTHIPPNYNLSDLKKVEDDKIGGCAGNKGAHSCA
jgi:hypothetical protein